MFKKLLRQYPLIFDIGRIPIRPLYYINYNHPNYLTSLNTNSKFRALNLCKDIKFNNKYVVPFNKQAIYFEVGCILFIMVMAKYSNFSIKN